MATPLYGYRDSSQWSMIYRNEERDKTNLQTCLISLLGNELAPKAPCILLLDTFV